MKYCRGHHYKHPYIFFEEAGQKVVMYNIITISFCPLLTNLGGFGAEDARLFLGGIRTENLILKLFNQLH